MAYDVRIPEEIQACEMMLRLLADAIPAVIWSTDRRLRFTSFFGAGLAALNLRPDQVVGKTLFEYFQTEDPDFPPVAAHRRALRGESVSYEIQWAGRTYQARVAPLPDGEDGVAGCTGIAHDITERKGAEEALRESEQQYRAIFEQAGDSIVLVDAESGALVEFNSRAHENLGYTREQFQNLKISDFEVIESVEEVREHIKDIVRKGRDVFETKHRVKGGEIRNILVSSRAISLGRRSFILSIWRDVTERKRAEEERERFVAELEAKNAELERFAYTVSHDFKTPLITIQGFLGMLEQDTARGKVDRMKEDMARIRNAAAKMQQLLDGLLELSRIGRLVDPRQEVSLGELAHEAVEMVAGAIAARGAEVEISSDLPVLFGERLRLLEVLQNLIDNAVKFIGDRPEPRVEIGVRQDGGETVCYVRDNGIGIDPRYHQKVFGLFDQLDPESEGTGVGLALVKRIVEVHGGRIWIESEGRGQGCTFCFTLPHGEGSTGHDN